jgi:hypothetical protein
LYLALVATSPSTSHKKPRIYGACTAQSPRDASQPTAAATSLADYHFTITIAVNTNFTVTIIMPNHFTLFRALHILASMPVET